MKGYDGAAMNSIFGRGSAVLTLTPVAEASAATGWLAVSGGEPPAAACAGAGFGWLPPRNATPTSDSAHIAPFTWQNFRLRPKSEGGHRIAQPSLPMRTGVGPGMCLRKRGHRSFEGAALRGFPGRMEGGFGSIVSIGRGPDFVERPGFG
jgi:hypothetical protein